MNKIPTFIGFRRYLIEPICLFSFILLFFLYFHHCEENHYRDRWIDTVIILSKLDKEFFQMKDTYLGTPIKWQYAEASQKIDLNQVKIEKIQFLSNTMELQIYLFVENPNSENSFELKQINEKIWTRMLGDIWNLVSAVKIKKHGEDFTPEFKNISFYFISKLPEDLFFEEGYVKYEFDKRKKKLGKLIIKK